MPRSFGLAELGVWHSLIIKLMRWISSEFFPHDSGNVTQLVHASDGSIVANYQYDPYGKTRVATGNGYESINPFRYQTKFTDNDSGLIYYGYRYYSHGLGRFLNQDPIGEKGGLNLYAFVGNDPVNQREFLGLSVIREGGPDEYHWWREGLNATSDGNSNWRKILTHAYNMYYNSWTAGQRNDFQVATLAAYHHQDTDRHDEASLDQAVGKAVDDAVARLNSENRSPMASKVRDTIKIAGAISNLSSNAEVNSKLSPVNQSSRQTLSNPGNYRGTTVPPYWTEQTPMGNGCNLVYRWESVVTNILVWVGDFAYSFTNQYSELMGVEVVCDGSTSYQPSGGSPSSGGGSGGNGGTGGYNPNTPQQERGCPIYC